MGFLVTLFGRLVLLHVSVLSPVLLLGSDFNKEEVLVMIKVALLCTKVTATQRPTMSSVVSILEGRTIVEEVYSETSEVLDEKR